ncbi:MAG: DM13 domain-containing protein [Chloroflexi bacterium]|nr:DM13 domain-containing protein [Chloroflexota bacterium]MDA1146511.1 DM13 domain-containing protein [Chloroflexota bacterium]
MSVFGDLERTLADLYPYRVPLTLAGALLGAAAIALILRRGWHQPVWRWVDGNRLIAALTTVVVLAAVLPGGYYLLSPLWQRTTVIEASPLDGVAATNLATDATAAATAASGAGAATAVATPQPAGTSLASPTAEGTPATAATPATGTATAALPRLVGSGPFTGADDFHFANGQALIVETAPGQFVLRVEEFSIRNGPDLYVYLSSDPDQPSADAIQLGRLKATDGAFNYDVPLGIDISSLNYAMVWCDQFAVLFAHAPLES